MTTFDNIIGRKIIKVQRIDSRQDYDFYAPLALVFTIGQLPEKLILSALDDGTSTDIRFMSDKNIDRNFGFEFNEGFLNDLKPKDELNELNNKIINRIRIAEFIEPQILGNGFLINQGKFAGIEIIAEGTTLLFKNNSGGWIDINDDVSELPNPERWKWK